MDSKEMAPGDIERRSFEIITEELGGARSRRSKSPS